MSLKTKNKISLLIIVYSMLCTFGFAQKISPVFKYDLKYFFYETMTSGSRLIVWSFKNEVKKDSSLNYYAAEKKIAIRFKFKDYRGACDFVLTDSINKTVVTGSFANGLALLCDQGDAFTSSGTAIVVLRKYYEGIADGTWTYSDLKGVLQEQITYKKERGK